MRIALGADHAGLPMKDHLRDYLQAQGHSVDDVVTHSGDSTDYPDYAGEVARRVASAVADRGLLVCGSGVGMAIAANKVVGARAANCFSAEICALARAHNDANILTLGGRFLSEAEAEEIVQAFLDTPFEGGRHQRRVDKISALEHSALEDAT